MTIFYPANNFKALRTSMLASEEVTASDKASASATEIDPAASNLSMAAFHERAYAYSSVNGSGACVNA